MMKASLWVIIIIAVAFVAFLMGYSLPPFLEVGFGKGGKKIETGAPVDKDLMKHYEELYKEETGSESE
jgi:hypothetical protein